MCIVLIGNRINNGIAVFQRFGFNQTFSNTVLIIFILCDVPFRVGCCTNQSSHAADITVCIIFMTGNRIAALVCCKINNRIKSGSRNRANIRLRKRMQTGCFFDESGSAGIIGFDGCITRFIYFRNDAVFAVVIGKRICAVCIGCLYHITIGITVILGRIPHDIHVFNHFIVLILTIRIGTVSDFVYFIGLPVSLDCVCLYSIFLIVIIRIGLDQHIIVIFLQTGLLKHFVIHINLLQTGCIGQPIHRTVVVVYDLICHFVIAVCDFAKSAVAVILIRLRTAGNTGGGNQLKIAVVRIGHSSVCRGILNAGNTRMLAVSVVGDFVSSVGRIGHNSLIVRHCRNGQLISFRIFYPIEFTVRIEMILRLSRIRNRVFITGFCHGAVSIQALKSAVAIILECGIGTIRKNYLIVTGRRFYDFGNINIKIPANTEAAFLIVHGVIGSDKIRFHARRCDTQIRKGFCIVTGSDMYAVTDFPAFAIKRVIRFVIRSPPWSEPVVFCCKFINWNDSVFIIKIKTAFCIVTAVFIIDIGFRIIPKNGLLSAGIAENDGLCAGRINRFCTGFFVDNPSGA